MSKDVIVTGGAGFIGSHLCERLLAEGYTVYSLDNYFTGSKDNHITGVRYYYGSASDICNLFLNLTPKYVFHLGEYSRVEQSFDDIDLVWDMNTKGIQSVLKYCRITGAKLIYAGSSTKFSDTLSDCEGYEQSPYAFSKALNTNLVNSFHKWFNINYAIIYFYNVYGGREIKDGQYSTVVAKFKKSYEDMQPVNITAPGTQLRNFTYIDDIIDGIILVAKNGFGDNYGIGNPKAYSVIELAEMFGLDYTITKSKRGNRLSAKVITDKIESLGWKPKTDLSDYIKGVINE